MQSRNWNGRNRLSMIALASIVFFFGCGTSPEWPSSEGDYARVAAERGLASIWGVNFVIEKTVGEEAEFEVTGTLGEEPGDADAQANLRLGGVVIRLETTETKHFALVVDERPMGKVVRGNRVVISDDRQVFVNNKPRGKKK